MISDESTPLPFRAFAHAWVNQFPVAIFIRFDKALFVIGVHDAFLDWLVFDFSAVIIGSRRIFDTMLDV